MDETPRTCQSLMGCVNLRLLLEEVLSFYVKEVSEPFVLEIWTFATCSSYGGVDCFVGHFVPFSDSVLLDVESRFSGDFSEPSMANSCWSSKARVANSFV